MSVPSLPILRTGLRAALGRGRDGRRAVKVVERHHDVSRSTFSSEIVTCEVDQRRMHLFCKYSTPHQDATGHRAYGHRRGVAFEADVYEHVLRPLGVSAPALRGIYRGTAPRETWLLLEHLRHATPVNKVPDALTNAAEWIGHFHALTERGLTSTGFPFLRQYDAAYYRGWAVRAARYVRRAGLAGPWLKKICEGFEDTIEDLLAAPQTVIHGEYYPANVLVHRGRIRPVDWETAAQACGEIDIASLTVGWSAAVTRDCERAYRSARWSGPVPRGFQRRLQAARFYTYFRWAGEPSAWTTQDGRDFYAAQLRLAGERMGLC